MRRPFGYGTRMCLGFRVAEIEIKSLLARLLLDWEITVEDEQEYTRLMRGMFVETVEYPKLKFTARSE